MYNATLKLKCAASQCLFSQNTPLSVTANSQFLNSDQLYVKSVSNLTQFFLKISAEIVVMAQSFSSELQVFKFVRSIDKFYAIKNKELCGCQTLSHFIKINKNQVLKFSSTRRSNKLEFNCRNTSAVCRLLLYLLQESVMRKRCSNLRLLIQDIGTVMRLSFNAAHAN